MRNMHFEYIYIYIYIYKYCFNEKKKRDILILLFNVLTCTKNLFSKYKGIAWVATFYKYSTSPRTLPPGGRLDPRIPAYYTILISSKIKMSSDKS